jgi:hypothetical protein
MKMDAQEQFAQYPLALREEAYQAVRLQIGPDAPMKIRDLLTEAQAIELQRIDVDAPHARRDRLEGARLAREASERANVNRREAFVDPPQIMFRSPKLPSRRGVIHA